MTDHGFLIIVMLTWMNSINESPTPKIDENVELCKSGKLSLAVSGCWVLVLTTAGDQSPDFVKTTIRWNQLKMHSVLCITRNWVMVLTFTINSSVEMMMRSYFIERLRLWHTLRGQLQASIRTEGFHTWFAIVTFGARRSLWVSIQVPMPLSSV